MTEKDKRITAYHEAGHAIVSYFCKTADPVHEISIIPRGMAAGYTLNLPEDDRSHLTKAKMAEQIVMLLGGRVAEKLVLDDISTGASNDLERATDTARSMVTRYGFSERLGPVVYGSDPHETFLGRDFSSGRGIPSRWRLKSTARFVICWMKPMRRRAAFFPSICSSCTRWPVP